MKQLMFAVILGGACLSVSAKTPYSDGNEETGCRASADYRLWIHQAGVVSLREQLADWKANQAQQRRYARESGVRDLAAERNAGEWVVQLSDNLKSEFADYRGYGGKAKTPARVTPPEGRDPCEGAP
jgi:hypothetical protein